MKKTYQKPLAELIEFVPNDAIMNGDMGGMPGIGGEQGGEISSGDIIWGDEDE